MAQTEALADVKGSNAAAILERESGLHRNLTPRQLSMIAVGGAIGTGLFLGSALSVKLAGPGVILSYPAAATIALALMWALGEMAIAHPVAGSFGVYAEMYVHPWAGFAMRYSYWLGQGGGVDLLQTLVPRSAVLDLDCRIFGGAHLGERQQRFEFRHVRILVCNAEGRDDCSVSDFRGRAAAGHRVPTNRRNKLHREWRISSQRLGWRGTRRSDGGIQLSGHGDRRRPLR